MITRFTAEQLQQRYEEFYGLLKNVVDDGASIGFLPPLTDEVARWYWDGIAADVAAGRRVLLVELDGETIVGSVQLGLEMKPNGLHRAEVQKLIVHTEWRRRGIARRLMLALEEAAHEHQRTLLVLDTREGDPSERLYRQLGYTVAGVIPFFARNGEGTLDSTVLYYKVL